MSADNPFADVALEAVSNPVNVATSLDFIVQRTINAKDPEQCYAEDLIRAVAVAPVSVREATKKRLAAAYGKDFAARRWLAAVKEAKEELISSGPASTLIVSESGTPKPILANAVIEMQALTLGLDTFAYRVVILKPTPWGTDGEWRDRDVRAATEWLQHRGVCCATPVTREAALRVADKNTFSSLINRLDALEFTGESRLDTWLTEFLGVPESNYVRAIGAAWLISAVARAYRPGCKADHMLLLEGPQGKRKSMAMRALVNGHTDADRGIQLFGDDPPDIDDKDLKQYIQGLWVVELAEMDAVRGKEWSSVKRFLSTQTDRFRAPYGYETQSYPRQTIFCGSVNDYDYLGDPTGSRRMWPVRVGTLDIDGLLKWGPQLWAEAVERYKAGAKWWLSEEMEAAAREEQAARMPDNPWISRIGDALEISGVTETSVREMADKFSVRDRSGEIHIARTLVELGWVKFQKRRGNAREWLYRRAGASE